MLENAIVFNVIVVTIITIVTIILLLMTQTILPLAVDADSNADVLLILITHSVVTAFV